MKDTLELLGRIWLFAAVLVGAAGCSWLSELPIAARLTPTAAPATPERPAATLTPTPSPTPTPQPSTQGMTLELWVPELLSPYEDSDLSEAFAAQLDSFTSSYSYRGLQLNVTVKRGTGTGGLYNLLTTASEVAPSILPDLLVLNQHDLLLAAAEGILQPVGAELSSPADYYTATLDSVRDSDGLWAFPYLARADQMAYRQGITETAPITWSAVLSGSYSLLFPAGSPEGLAGDALLQIYLGSGGRVMDQAGLPSLDRASLERTYGFFLDLRRAGLLDAERALTMPNAAASWSAYEEGAGHLSPVPFGQFWANVPEDTRPAWAPTEEGDPITLFYTWGIAVVAQDPVRRDAALLLAKWLVAADHMAAVARAAELAPTRHSAVVAWGLSSEDVLFADALLSHGVAALPPTIDTPVRRALQAGLVALLQDEADTPESAASIALMVLRR
jgi:ABC-type glycerol-3-phosphate transport system substrate-binding protein